jgi:hypothetical protein
MNEIIIIFKDGRITKAYGDIQTAANVFPHANLFCLADNTSVIRYDP